LLRARERTALFVNTRPLGLLRSCFGAESTEGTEKNRRVLCVVRYVTSERFPSETASYNDSACVPKNRRKKDAKSRHHHDVIAADERHNPSYWRNSDGFNETK